MNRVAPHAALSVNSGEGQRAAILKIRLPLAFPPIDACHQAASVSIFRPPR